jgi:hypothetical protein
VRLSSSIGVLTYTATRASERDERTVHEMRVDRRVRVYMEKREKPALDAGKPYLGESQGSTCIRRVMMVFVLFPPPHAGSCERGRDPDVFRFVSFLSD